MEDYFCKGDKKVKLERKILMQVLSLEDSENFHLRSERLLEYLLVIKERQVLSLESNVDSI